MKKGYEYAIIYAAGGVYYALIEILWRGYSHWTMMLTGGFCILCLYMLNEKMGKVSLAFKCIAGCFVITAVELAVGSIVNTLLDWDVWDYSHKSCNIMGQICLNSSLTWLLLCIPGIAGCTIAKKLFDKTKEK